MSSEKTLTLTINGRTRSVPVAAGETLLETLRRLHHFEVKSGCEKGDCGACAVLVEGRAVDSCLTLAWTVEGAAIATVAGLAPAGETDPVQQAFIDRGAVQCGYCTPGLIVAARSLLNREPEPDEDAIRLALSGNLCRCTGYTKVFDAVAAAAEALRAEAGR